MDPSSIREFMSEARIKLLGFSGSTPAYFAALCARFTSVGDNICLQMRANDVAGFEDIHGGVNDLVQGVTGFPAEAWHDFRMDCVGSIVSAWVDGVEIGSHDTENAQGGIALQVSGVTAVFDDVLVTPL